TAPADRRGRRIAERGSDMGNRPGLVSVVIPVFNGERYLAEAIESVIGQSYPSLEIIVVDDGSTDRTPEISAAFDQVRAFRQDHLGVAAARNLGITRAEGEFLSFLDADDLWEERKTALQMEALEADETLAGVICRFRNFFEAGVTPPEGVDPSHFSSEKHGDMPSLCSLLVRREAFLGVGLLDQQCRTGEDIDWFARARDQGVAFRRLPEVLVHRRLHDTNLSYRAPEDRGDLLRIFRASLARKREQPASDGEAG
ncbi:glycosyltransferase family 2 protein, partial [Gemmatimonadota bacterium]